MKKLSIFKKVAMLMVVAMVTVSVSAQEKGDKAIGASVYLGTGNSYSQIGLGGKFRYNILDRLRAEAQGTYYLPKYNWSMIDASINGHYLFGNEDFVFYPLAGLGLNYFHWDSGYGFLNSSSSYVAFNFGGGIDFKIAGNIYLNAEATYRVSDWWDRITLSGGIVFKF
ncbi:MAG: porin family protein [Tannerella sp.]|jgi:outer membrane protein X|nr:porin family protein [Tannerella sp.]